MSNSNEAGKAQQITITLSLLLFSNLYAFSLLRGTVVFSAFESVSSSNLICDFLTFHNNSHSIKTSFQFISSSVGVHYKAGSLCPLVNRFITMNIICVDVSPF